MSLNVREMFEGGFRLRVGSGARVRCFPLLKHGSRDGCCGKNYFFLRLAQLRLDDVNFLAKLSQVGGDLFFLNVTT